MTRTSTPPSSAQPKYTLRQLQLFIAACDTGSITQAGQLEQLTQSAVSSSIRQLESATGVKLLDRRHAQGVVPTAAGVAFLAEARKLVEESIQLDRKAKELTGEVRGRLTVGFNGNIAPLIAAQLCARFTERYPEVDISILEGTRGDLTAALRDGIVPLAFLNGFEIEPPMRFEMLVELPPFIGIAASHPAAGRRSLTIQEVAAMPMVHFESGQVVDYQLGLFKPHGLEPLIGTTTRFSAMVRSLVANGYGYTILNSRPMVGRSLDGMPITAVPLEGDHLPLQYGIATWHRDRETRLTSAFVEFTRNALSTGDMLGLRPVTVDSP